LRAELQPLADDNMTGSPTMSIRRSPARAAIRTSKFGHASNPTLDYDGKQTTLSFDVALAKPWRKQENDWVLLDRYKRSPKGGGSATTFARVLSVQPGCLFADLTHAVDV
jgi:hypothetical protein